MRFLKAFGLALCVIGASLLIAAAFAFINIHFGEGWSMAVCGIIVISLLTYLFYKLPPFKK
jgi:maltodextrin utilization protein YvdJ